MESKTSGSHPELPDKRQRGGQTKYSDIGLPYCQTIGFAQSMVDLLDAGVEMPDYTLLCKRSTALVVDVTMPLL